MQKLIVILTLLSTILISGCEFPRPTPVERCVISITFNKCRCHDYQFYGPDAGRVSNSIDHELSYCDNSVVFRTDAWAEIRAWGDELYQFELDQNKNSSSAPDYSNIEK